MTVKKIPRLDNIIGTIELDPTSKIFSRQIESWFNNRLIPTFNTIDSLWNVHIDTVIGNAYRNLNKYNVPISYFDGANLFMDINADEDSELHNGSRPLLISESIYLLYNRLDTINAETDGLASEVALAKGYAATENFLDFQDTPGTYTGQAGKYVGVGLNGTSFEFLNPLSNTLFLDLTDTQDSYIGANNYLVSAPATIKGTSLDDMRWHVEQHQCTTDFPVVDINGTAADNVLYSIDLQDEVACPAQTLRLGTTFHGARIAFKAKLGNNNLSSKFIEGDTSSGVRLHEGSGVGNYQLDINNAYTFVYDTSTLSYYKVLEYTP